jgi:hypothetical protein
MTSAVNSAALLALIFAELRPACTGFANALVFAVGLLHTPGCGPVAIVGPGIRHATRRSMADTAPSPSRAARPRTLIPVSGQSLTGSSTSTITSSRRSFGIRIDLRTSRREN